MTQPGDATATQKFDGDNPPVIVNPVAGTGGDTTQVQTVKTTEKTDAYVKVDRWDDESLPEWGVDRMALHHVGSQETETTTTVVTTAEAGSGDGAGNATGDARGLRADVAPGRLAGMFDDGPAEDKDGDGVRDDEQAGKDGAGAEGKDKTKGDGKGDATTLAGGKNAGDVDSDGDGVTDRDEDMIGAAAGASDAAAAAGRKGRNGSRNVRRQEAEQAQAAVGSDEELEKTRLG